MTQEQYQQKLANLRLSWFHHVQDVTHKVAKHVAIMGLLEKRTTSGGTGIRNMVLKG